MRYFELLRFITANFGVCYGGGGGLLAVYYCGFWGVWTSKLPLFEI